MPKVTVYRMTHYDINSDQKVPALTDRYATRQAAERVGLEIIQSTAKEIDDSQLDAEGFVESTAISN